MNDEILNIIDNIKFTDSVNKEIDALKSKVEKLKSEIYICNSEINRLYYDKYSEESSPLRRTFNEILDEIARQNNISREHINIKFEDKILGGYFYRKDETKLETVEKQLDRWGNFTISFSVALNPDSLDDMEPLFCLYPLTDEEKSRRQKLKKVRDEDPLYREYTYNTRLFEVQKSGKKMLDHLRREHGISAEMAWFFSVEDYEDVFYYIEPNYIDLDEDNPFTRALRGLLSEEELNIYEERKIKYNIFKTNRDKLIKEKKIQVDKLKKEMNLILLLIEEKNKVISELEWPSIIINVGDFIKTIYSFPDIPIYPSNSMVSISGKKEKSNSYEYSDDVFTLRIKYELNKSLSCIDETFDWKVNYSEEMTDGETIYDKVLKINRFFNRNLFNCWNGIRNIQNFIMHFNPYYFFRDDKHLSRETIRRVIVKCLLLENYRNGKINNRDIGTLFSKYVDLLSHDDYKNTSSSKIEGNYIKNDILKLVRENPVIFRTISSKYHKDPDIALEAVIMDGLLLEYVSEELKYEEKIVKPALKSNPMALKFASNLFKNDFDTVMQCVKRNGLALEFASPDMKRNSLVVLEAVKENGMAIEFADPELFERKKNKEIVLTAASNSGRILKFVRQFKNDRDVLLEAARQNGLAIQFADKDFFDDDDIVLIVLSQRHCRHLATFISPRLQDDIDFMKKLCEIDKSYEKYASPRVKDEFKVEFIKKFADNYLDIKQKVYKI